jgi:hypothetical protein
MTPQISATDRASERRALPEHPNLNHEDAKDEKVHGGGARRAAGLYRPSSKSFLLLFFKKEALSFCSFLKKRTKKLF